MSSLIHVQEGCPFCPDNGLVEIIAENDGGYVTMVKDSPIQGAFFTIPRLHVVDFFGLPNDWTRVEKDLLRALGKDREDLFQPWMSFNANLNLGRPAGQRVPHLHNWWVPRDGEHEAMPCYQFGPATLIGRDRDHVTVHRTPSD